MRDFIEWTEQNLLIDVPSKGVNFTWYNGRSDRAFVERKLDRDFCNHGWIIHSHTLIVTTLPKLRSDHHPIILDSSFTIHLCTYHFRFLSQLKVSNKDVFGEIHSLIKNHNGNLEKIQKRISSDGPSENNRVMEKKARLDLEKVLIQEELSGPKKPTFLNILVVIGIRLSSTGWPRLKDPVTLSHT
ncbi:hypothetical protein KIW84_041126 [Lathyrus oleraceus]|uniref:Uncharacterized protein n=1 Tax=Pisum sativum TaxID=3888 RepID=A0A9D5AQR8_PEA|nr:hypothetical protein KIW84_041126 [Pisum sativum]